MIPAMFAAATCSSHQFFFLPSWWEYLKTDTTNGNCSIAFSFPGDTWLVGLAIIDILLRLASLLAVISIIIASIEYIISTGNPERVTSARKRIINSLVGLAIAFVAVVLVTFVGKTFGK